MSMSASAGALRTRIRVLAYVDDFSEEQVEVASVRCKWVNAHGREVYDAKQAGVEESATLTLRYTPKLTATCMVYRGDDPKPYEVISVDDVENRHVWLEVKLQRKGASK